MFLWCTFWGAHCSWEAAACGQSLWPTLRLCRHMKGCYATPHMVPSVYSDPSEAGRPRVTFRHLCPPRNVQSCQKNLSCVPICPPENKAGARTEMSASHACRQWICHEIFIERSTAPAAWHCLFSGAYTFLNLPRANSILNESQVCFLADVMYFSINTALDINNRCKTYAACAFLKPAMSQAVQSYGPGMSHSIMVPCGLAFTLFSGFCAVKTIIWWTWNTADHSRSAISASNRQCVWVEGRYITYSFIRPSVSPSRTLQNPSCSKQAIWTLTSIKEKKNWCSHRDWHVEL